MARPRDNQRKRVLAAERVFARRLDNPLSSRQLQSLADRITRSAWFRKLDAPFTAIQVFTDDHNTGCHQPVAKGLLVIYLNEKEATAPDLFHEISHHLVPTNVQSHGPEFTKQMLECARKWLGPEYKKMLYEDYRAVRAKTRVLSPEGRASLQESAARSRRQLMKEDLADLLSELAQEA